MLWQLVCTGRQWCDFVSFAPELPVELRLRVKRFTLEGLVKEQKTNLEPEVAAFVAELDSMEAALRAQMKQEAA